MSLTNKINQWFTSSGNSTTSGTGNTLPGGGSTGQQQMGSLIISPNPNTLSPVYNPLYNPGNFTYTGAGTDLVIGSHPNFIALVGELRLSIGDVVFSATKDEQKVILEGVFNPLDAKGLIDSLEVTRKTTKVNIFSLDKKYLYTIDNCNFVSLEYSQHDGTQFELAFTFKNLIDDPKIKQVYEMTLKDK